MKIILASQSPQRTALLTQIGVTHGVYPVAVDEETYFTGTRHFLASVRALALAKARAAVERFPDAAVIGADTVISFRDTVIGKPKNAADARRILRRLSGRRHIVVTGVALVRGKTGASRTAVAVSEVYFRSLSPRDIARYIASGEPMGRAGAYAIQGRGAMLVKKIAGSYSNIVGLPLELIAPMLIEAGYRF